VSSVIDSIESATSEPVAAGAIDREVGEMLIQLIESMKTYFFTAIEQVGLTPPQAFALRSLHEPCPMRDLADQMGYDASYITGIVDRLEARGLVERTPDPVDRRVKRLVVTAAGVELRNQLEVMVFTHLPVLDRLTLDQRGQLHGLLTILTAEPPPAS
jgi:DNA-binding MarR family transcriptional regulator